MMAGFGAFLNALAVLGIVLCMGVVFSCARELQEMHPLARAFGGEAELGAVVRRWLMIAVICILWLVFGA